MDLIDNLDLTKVYSFSEFRMIYGYLIRSIPDMAIQFVNNDTTIIPKYYSSNYEYFIVNVYANRLDIYPEKLDYVILFINENIIGSKTATDLSFKSDYATLFNLVLHHLNNRIKLEDSTYKNYIRTILSINTIYKFKLLAELTYRQLVPYEIACQGLSDSYHSIKDDGMVVNKLVRYLNTIKQKDIFRYNKLCSCIKEGTYDR